MTAALVQATYLTRRALDRAIRQPGHIFFALVFPMVFLFVVSGGLDRAAHLPGFPADSFLAFALAIPFVHGGLFVAINAAVELGRDIETGFLNRLALTPARSVPLVLGHLLAAAALGVGQALVYLGVGTLAGVRLESGLLGVPVILALAALASLAFGSLGTAIALRTGNSESVQGLFPVFFVALFLSSMVMPRHLIEADWFRAIATLNPVSYLIEGLRSLVIAGWDGQALALAFGCGTALVAAALAASAAAFGERMTRT
ncbi:MAG TPA: ABC transporter permease [Gaiellaceae bacterium]|nr:ABC transporter permease [Gaiellaceae bacterium]